MNSSWKKYKLLEFAEINPQENIKKGQLAKKIAMEKIIPYCKQIPSYEISKFNGGTKFKNGDTIMARITPCLENGKISKVTVLEDEEIGFGSTEYIVFRAIENISDSDFLYYLITSPLVKEPAIKSMVGSSGRQRVQIDVVKNLELDIPPLDIQQKIAKVLSAIDDKIELNNSINNNLEQQAQAIFKSWFVDFEPFGGTKPEAWVISNLSTIADYLNGLAMQKFRPNENEIGIPVLKIKELRQGFCDVQSDLCSPNIKPEYLINDGDVIFSWSGTLWLDLWCSGLCGLNQHLFKVSSEKYDKWFYYFWTKYHLNKFIAIAADKATTMGHIKREDLDKSDVIIPDEKTYIQLNSILTPMLELMVKNRVENRHLTQLRDTLLPKLMNGEIDVSNVEVIKINKGKLL